MSDEIRLEKTDVEVHEVDDDECGECTVGPTAHRVLIDFRSAGIVQEIGRYCRPRADMVADRIRDGLPESTPPAPRGGE